VDPQTYNAIFTMHGITMLLLSAIRSWYFMNFLVPLMIGAPGRGLPTLNALSFCCPLSAGCWCTSAYRRGPPDADGSRTRRSRTARSRTGDGL